MAEIVNLRAARKARARAEREATAATNRALHGRTRQQRKADETERARRERELDGVRLDQDGEAGD